MVVVTITTLMYICPTLLSPFRVQRVVSVPFLGSWYLGSYGQSHWSLCPRSIHQYPFLQSCGVNPAEPIFLLSKGASLDLGDIWRTALFAAWGCPWSRCICWCLGRCSSWSWTLQLCFNLLQRSQVLFLSVYLIVPLGWLHCHGPED